MSNVELTHEIMRKLTAALAKVDSENLRQFERINLVADAFGWKGDALMHHLKTPRRRPVTQPEAGDPASGMIDPKSGSISLFVGTSPATRRACIGTRAAALAKELMLPVYGESDTWRVGDRLVPTGIIMIGLRTIDDWRHAVKLAKMGNRVLVDTWRAEDDLSKMLPLLGALPEEMTLVSSITKVAEYLGTGGQVWSTTNERSHPFRST